jgi:hypothetical protein
MKRVLKILAKIGLLSVALLIIFFTALILYLANPKLINKTLPAWLQVEQEGPHNHPRFAGALSFDELKARYDFEGESLRDIKEFAEQENIRLKHQGHIIRRMVSDRPRDLRSMEVPPFSERLMGYQILFMKEYPSQTLDLMISEHRWFDYYLVIEFVSD